MRKLITALICIVLIGSQAQAKEVKEYLGEWWCSTYHASDNTPAGSRATSSGARATEYWTAAVDMYNPLVPMGTIIEVEGYGRFKIQDVGGFGRYNGGMRAFDLFMPEGIGFCKPLKVWIVRPETKTEKKKRKKKERRKRQQEAFTLAPASEPVGTIVADPKILKHGSTVQIGLRYYEVTETRKGLGNTVLVGGLSSVRAGVTIDSVYEEAVG
jgi:3D (Asp-Asp-Asp) domain-containing protein